MNLISCLKASCLKAFVLPSARSRWDIVFNCAAETRPGLSDAVYEEGITKLSQNCARQSGLQLVGRYVELSSGNMLSNEKKAVDEECDPVPWTKVAKCKAKVEKELPQIEGLSYTIVRLPLVYGKGDRRGLSKFVNQNVHNILCALIFYLSASHHNCCDLQIPWRHNETTLERQHEIEHRSRI